MVLLLKPQGLKFIDEVIRALFNGRFDGMASLSSSMSYFTFIIAIGLFHDEYGP